MRLPVMILAAGFGTRMGALTKDRPKPLIEVSGRALIDHALDEALAGGGPIAVNTHYHADQMAAHLAGKPVHILHETPKILDSGGGARNALPVLGEGPLATLNADAVWAGPRVLSHLANHWDPDRMDALLALVPQPRAIGRETGGDFALATDGQISPDTSGHVYTGAQILGEGILGRWPPKPFSMWEVWRAALDTGRLFGCLYPGQWADVGHPGGIAQAEAMIDV